MENLLTKEQAAEKMGCHPRSVKRYCDNNGIVYTKTPLGVRFYESELQKHFDSLRVFPVKKDPKCREKINNSLRKSNLAIMDKHPSALRKKGRGGNVNI